MIKKNIISADVHVGHLVKYKRQELKVVLSEDGCRGCVFQTEAGARFCDQSSKASNVRCVEAKNNFTMKLVVIK